MEKQTQEKPDDSGWRDIKVTPAKIEVDEEGWVTSIEAMPEETLQIQVVYRDPDQKKEVP